MSSELQKPDNEDNLTTLKKSLGRIDKYMTAVIVVTLFGFLTLLVTVSGLVIDAYRFKAATYQNLVNSINQTNQIIGDLKQDSDNAVKDKMDIFIENQENSRRDSNWLLKQLIEKEDTL